MGCRVLEHKESVLIMNSPVGINDRGPNWMMLHTAKWKVTFIPKDLASSLSGHHSQRQPMTDLMQRRKR